MTKRKPPGEPRKLPGFPPRRFVEMGQRIGRSTVIEAEIRIPYLAAGPRRTVRGVRLLCDCGTEFTCKIYDVLGGHRTGCGCGIKAPRGAGHPPNRAARNLVFKDYQAGAWKRGLVWELTGEDFDRLTAQDCHYCGAPPGQVKDAGVQYENGDFVYTGIDRKDNTLGYTLENVVPSCTFCNRAKWDRSYDAFMAWIAQMTEYRWFHPELTPSGLFKRSA